MSFCTCYISLHCAYSLHGDSRPKAFTWWLVFTIKQKTKILEALQGSARAKRKTCSMNSTDHWEAKKSPKTRSQAKSLCSRRTEVWFTLIFFFCFLASLFRLVSKTDTTWEFATWLSQIIRCDIIHGKFYEMPLKFAVWEVTWFGTVWDVLEWHHFRKFPDHPSHSESPNGFFHK